MKTISSGSVFSFDFKGDREQGKKFGRPSALDVGQKRKIAERYAAGETMQALADEYEVGVASIHRALQGPFEQAA